MLDVKVETANKLTKPVFTKIKKSVTKKYGNDVVFEEVINPSVIGGIKIVVGQKEIDLTVEGKIERMMSKIRDNK